MECIFRIPEWNFLELKQHLFPKQIVAEECAFLFADYQVDDSQMYIECRDSYYLKPNDFSSRSEYHFEIEDHVRSKVIKKAHDMNSILVEVHSHINQEDARFSPTDWHGFNEFVPHILWRLRGKPYVAVVFGSNSFDGLVWPANSKSAIQLAIIDTGRKIHMASRRSLNSFHHDGKI